MSGTHERAPNSMPAWGERLIRLLAERTEAGDPAVNERVLVDLVARLETERARADAGPALVPPANGAYRWDHELIAQHVARESSVLDLGCGSGTLLHRLIAEKDVRGQGVEWDREKVLECVSNAVPVFQSNLDEGLGWFPDGSFDYVVLEETVQTLHRPEVVLSEVVRIGRQGILTFPNFGHWRVRLDLALNGRMPVTRAIPYTWFNSPNIHHLTLRDFEDWMATAGIRLIDGHAISDGEVRPIQPGDNVFAEEVMLVIERRAG